MQNTSQITRGVIAVLFLTALVGTMTLWAQAPNQISYSGLLTNPQGEPREGSFTMTFRIYDRASGGTPLYTKEINNVRVRKGQFSVTLGPFTDPSVFLQGSGERYVEMQVGSESPLLPRQRLISVPFALNAASVQSTPSTAWTAFPFAPGYGNFADVVGQPQWQRAQYRKMGGDVVCLRGIAAKTDRTAIPSNTVLGTLPVGFRPPADLVYSVSDALGPRRIDVHSNGNVRNVTSTQYETATLDGICFSTSP